MPNPTPPSEPISDQPLRLTVHSLPTPHTIDHTQARRTWSGRYRMLAVLLVCAAPVIASYVTYYFIRPQNQKSHGQLITPSRPIPAIDGQNMAQQIVPLSSLKNQWLLISVDSGACPQECQDRLYLQRQILTSLGRERDRFDWVWLVNDGAEIPHAIRPGLSASTVLRVAPQELDRWLEPKPGQRQSDHWYVVDPMGEWMMRFDPPFDIHTAPRIKRDLERLLRASASWDRAGR